MKPQIIGTACSSMKRFASNLIVFAVLPFSCQVLAFEGRINATFTRGAETRPLLYTVATPSLRVEITGSTWPYPINIMDMNSGALTLVFPHNRSFMRLKTAAPNASNLPPGFPAIPPGVGPQMQAVPTPASIGPTNLPGMPAMPHAPVLPQRTVGLPPATGSPAESGVGMVTMPVMSMMTVPAEKLELNATDETTNLLGYACVRYELKRRGEVMEIWATDKLFPFEPPQQNQPRRFGPQMIEEQWADALKAKGLFPLLAVLRFENGTERFRFEVRSIAAEKIRDPDGTLFQPPSGYHKVEPAPF
jgi:hypothetical protein